MRCRKGSICRELTSLGSKVPVSLSQCWKGASGVPMEPRAKPAQNDPVAAGSGTASGWLQSWVPGEPTWRPWATWASAGTWPSAQGSGTNSRQGSRARKLPLSRSLAIQVSCPCCGHACSSHSPASRCDWQLSTFPCHPDLADLAGHAS